MSRVADILMAQGEAAARSREQSGRLWGGTVANLAQVPAQIQQQDMQRQAAQQDLALGQQKLDQATRANQDQSTLDKVFADPSIYNPDHTFNREGIRAKLGPNGGHLWPHVEGIIDASDQSQGKLKEQQLAIQATQNELAGHQGLKIEASKYDPGTFHLGVTTLAQAGYFPKDVSDQLLSLTTPEQIKPVVEGWKAGSKIGQPKILKLGQGDTAFDEHDLSKPIATGAPKPPSNISELSVLATDPNKTPEDRQWYENALNKAKPPKPETMPASPEVQYLKALTSGDTSGAQRILKAIQDTARAKQDPAALATARELAGLRIEQARARLDDADTGSEKNQQKFEKEYRTVLARAISSRAGGLGGEDAKVQQANHLVAMFEQNYNPKTGGYDIPRVQLNELALGLAKLTAGSSPAGEGMLREFQQRTLKGDVAGALTWLTGAPVPANTQALTQYLKDSIERQGRTAETNREGEMGYLRSLAPTDLSEERRKALESKSLNPLRQMRILQNDKTGERKVQISLDGGSTWK